MTSIPLGRKARTLEAICPYGGGIFHEVMDIWYLWLFLAFVTQILASAGVFIKTFCIKQNPYIVCIAMRQSLREGNKEQQSEH